MYMPRSTRTCKSQSKGADTMKHTTTSPTPIRSEEPKRQTAREAIAANIQSIIEQLEAGHSEALTAYLNAMSRFHNYSFGNVPEIARQKPGRHPRRRTLHMEPAWPQGKERRARYLSAFWRPLSEFALSQRKSSKKTSPSRTGRCSSASATRTFRSQRSRKLIVE